MDEQLNQLLQGEEARQDATLNLIASENYPSREVGLALTSIAGSKYAEGYPGKRYYAGCETTIDEFERLAIELAGELFGVKYVNVQPHSGSNANLATYFAVLNPGDRVLAPALNAGGHLTHGSPASITSKLWQFEHYGVSDETGRYDMDEIGAQAKFFKPRLIIAGTSAYPALIDWSAFRAIADEVGAQLMADIAHLAGLMAAEVIPSAITHADVITTTTQKTLRGPRGGMIMTHDADLAKKIDRAVFPGLQGGPHMHTIAAKAQCLAEATQPEFKTYATQTLANAKALETALHKLKCQTWTDHTETHLLNIDTQQSFGMDGKVAEERLEAAGIIANREALPGDDSPLRPSGLRLGTPALTTRGLREAQMQKIAQLVVDVLRDGRDASSVAKDVANLTKLFPL